MFAHQSNHSYVGPILKAATQMTPFARLVLILVPISLVGCSGTNDPPSSSPPGDSNAASSMNDDHPTAPVGQELSQSQPSSTPPSSTPPNSAPPKSAPSGAKLTEGLKLPAGADPVGESSDQGDGQGDAGPAKPGEGGIEMPKESDAAADSTVNLSIASWSEIESHAKSTGRITVVDLWSLSCGPCLKEFPGLVRLSKSMPQRVSCIGVSLDYDGRKSKPPESYSENVVSFLTAVQSRFPNFLCSTPSDDVYKSTQIPSIPAVLVFDTQGKLVKQFVDSGETIGFTYDKDVIPFVKGLAG